MPAPCAFTFPEICVAPSILGTSDIRRDLRRLPFVAQPTLLALIHPYMRLQGLLSFRDDAIDGSPKCTARSVGTSRHLTRLG